MLTQLRQHIFYSPIYTYTARLPHKISGGEAIKAVPKQVCHIINIREDGVTLIHGVFRHHILQGRDIYTELANECESWLRSKLAPRAAQEYSQDPSTKKRFFFPSYEYRFMTELTDQTDQTLTFYLTVILSRRGGEVLSQYQSEQVFRLPDLAMLPIKQKKR